MTVLTLALVTLAADPTPPPTPVPQKEHAWLQKLVGEWELVGTCTMAPGAPPMTMKGTESVKAVGGLWIVSDMRGEFDGMKMVGQMTLGYHTAKKRFTGTWVCDMCDHLTLYDGEQDAAGKVLTLHTEGPSPTDPTKTAKMKDVLEWQGADTRVMTSWVQGADGKWTEFMRLTAKRKK